jgi:CysZ protein
MAVVGLAADFLKAVGQLGDRRFAGVLAKGVGLTVVGLALATWSVVAGLGWLLPDTFSLPWVGEVGFVDEAVSWAAVGLMLVLSVVLMVPVAAAVVGFFLEDIAAAVEARHYPAAGAVTPLSIGVQAADALRFFGVLVAANLVAVVLYFGVPPLAPFVFWAVNGYLLGREYFQLVAMRRLGLEGAAALRRRHGLRLWIAGVLMAVPLSLPVVNLLVPVLGVAVFTHQFHRLAPRG